MLLKLLRTYLAPYKRLIAAIVLLQLLSTIASLFLPRLNADIIDHGVVTGDTGYILRISALMLAISLAQISGSIAATYLGARTAMGFGRDLRNAVFRRVGEFSSRDVASFGAPSLITRNTNDVQQVQMLAMMTFTLMLMAPITMVGGIIMAMHQDLGLSWLVMVAVPALGISLGFMISKMIPAYRAMQERIDGVNRVLREQTTGIRVLRAFVREPFEASRFAKANQELTDVSITVGRWIAGLFPVVMLVLNVASVAVLWFGGLQADAGEIQIGTLTAFLAYLVQILMSVMMATFTLIMVPRAAVSADRIGAVLNTTPSVVSPSKGITRVEKHGHLQFEAVRHIYPGAHDPVLRDIRFEARPGQTTAIIGATGAGKTTLVSLIPRLFDASSGCVLVDGVDVRHFDLDTLWSKIGLVPQKPYLFSGTIASNLRYGNPSATEEEMWAALDVAQAKDFVSALPGGLESPIAQGGTNLSGGQRQRISIARALVRKPEIYLFDDSFSALDLTTEAKLRQALRHETRDATVVIVAQRVSTIKDADQIVVIEDGAVVGLGTYASLLSNCRTFVEIVASQQMLQESA
jgi:ATP-binding cassette, subfamily B, multidrug efflux pump